MMRPSGIRRLGLALLLWQLARAACAAPLSLAELQSAIESELQRAYEDPAMARNGLARLGARHGAGPAGDRALLLARGLVAAEDDDEAESREAASQLERLTADPLGLADAALVTASLADHRGETEAALKSAAAALEIYRRECPLRPGCDYRSSSRALWLLVRHESRRGQNNAALEDANAALQLAREHGDRDRAALTLGLIGDLEGLEGDLLGGRRLLADAQREARASGSIGVQARLQVFEMRDAERRHDLAAARRAGEAGLALAQGAQLRHLTALMRANLADILVKVDQPRAAIEQVVAALPVAQQYADRRLTLMLVHNEALARIAVGETAAARHALDQLLAAHHAAGALAMEAEVLVEFGDALAAAGDMKGALELFHRERKLAAEVMAANREATLAQLRARYDREAQQRQLDQLARENALLSAQIANRDASQNLWVGVGVVLVLAMALVAVLYRRVREINRRLADNRDFLRAQSQRDPLTGLANRRCLHEVATQRGLAAAFRGTLLLIDVDHFKRVNDLNGHAAGDRVLVELARRLSGLVRPEDLVLRWGGEEFLIFRPDEGGEAGFELADRVLEAIGSSLVSLPEGDLRVTASIGYASFPLPERYLPVGLERALNLADMALYTAKREGRNRAIGLLAVNAEDAVAQQAIEADFDQAVQDGRAKLRRTLGPAAPLSVVGARQA